MGWVVSRKHILAITILMALPACAGGEGHGAVAPVTITWFASSLTNNEQDPRQPLIDAFEKAYPMIRVELVSAPSSTNQNRDTIRAALTSTQDGPGPDVYMGDVIWPAEFAADGLALPLNDHLPASFWTRFGPQSVDAASYQGKIYAAPFYADQGLLMYRKDLLGKAHLRAPPQTWAELVEDALILLHDHLVSDGFVWQGAQYEGLTCVWTEFAAAAGVQIPSARDSALRIDSPGSLEAVSFMRMLLTRGVSPADVTSLREPQAQQLFESGNAAFLRTWSSAYVDIAEMAGSPVRGKVGVAPLPGFGNGLPTGASAIGGWDLYVNPHTGHLPQALAFIKWMTDFPAQYTLALNGIIPANLAVRSDRAFRDKPVLAALRGAWPVHRPSGTPLYPAVSKVIYSAIYRALRGVAPAAALADARRQIGAILSAAPR